MVKGPFSRSHFLPFHATACVFFSGVMGFLLSEALKICSTNLPPLRFDTFLGFCLSPDLKFRCLSPPPPLLLWTVWDLPLTSYSFRFTLFGDNAPFFSPFHKVFFLSRVPYIYLTRPLACLSGPLVIPSCPGNGRYPPSLFRVSFHSLVFLRTVPPFHYKSVGFPPRKGPSPFPSLCPSPLSFTHSPDPFICRRPPRRIEPPPPPPCNHPFSPPPFL